MRGRPPWTLAGGLVVALGCSGLRVHQQTGLPEAAWPPENPRVRLEEVISLDGDLSGGVVKLLTRLGSGTGSAASFHFRRPYAVAWDGEDLLVADPDAGRVARIRPGGRLALSPPGAVAQPIGLAVCAWGIVASDSRAGTVALLDRDLERVRWLAQGLSRPTGVACGGERIYVVETGRHRILVLDARGKGADSPLGRRGRGDKELNFPTSIALSGGTLWVGDTLNFRVQQIDPATWKLRASFGRLGDAPGDMPRIKGIAVDRNGNLWVADAHLDQVALYDRDGTLLMDIGRTGEGPGEFSFPAGIAAHPDGRVAVADSFNRRLQIFRVLSPRAEALP